MSSFTLNQVSGCSDADERSLALARAKNRKMVLLPVSCAILSLTLLQLGVVFNVTSLTDLHPLQL